ncbi:MAG: hypothetical protein LUC39_01700 [Clostridiales bacterium]|nr:hypothetical protein [Clostridiales bacterium]
MAQLPIKPYNDGLVTICREMANSSSFSARVSPTEEDELEELCTLCFAEQSRRGQDVEYANQMGYRLDRRISTRRPPSLQVDTQCAAKIGSTLYHVSSVDITETEIYYSLTEVGSLA